MKIVADENIPFAREAFGRLGDVATLPGREMSAGVLRDAEALFVRSVTQINAQLLEGTLIRFVATATIGTDHVDQDYLAERGIGFAYAPGCNANSVAEYVTAALLVMTKRWESTLEGKTIGVVGVGNVGSRVAPKARALGMTVLQNDPPLERETERSEFVAIDEVYAADFITLHVPLTRTGPDRTFRMVSADFLDRMGRETVLINTSRGGVVDSRALMDRMKAEQIAGVVLDVFEGEPDVDPEMLERLDLATPHIAGYSFDGKVNGTFQIYEQACAFFGRDVEWDPANDMPVPEKSTLDLPEQGDDETLVARAVRAIYNIEEDDQLLRGMLMEPPLERGAYFDHLRKTYRRRREFYNTTVTVPAGRTTLARKLKGIGFKVKRA